jgi:hypothetical protein
VGIALIIWLLCGIGAGALANTKGRSASGWGCLGFMLGPIGLLIVACMDRGPTETERALLNGTLRKCPHCAEAITSDARKCRFCAEPVEPMVRPEPRRPLEIG